MRILLNIILIFLLSFDDSKGSNIYIASNNILGEILEEVVGTKGKVISIKDIGNPQKYEVSASSLNQISSASAIFYTSNELDLWVNKITGIKKIQMTSLLGNMAIKIKDCDTCTAINPYFWYDPLSVKSILNKIADTLSLLDKENAVDFKENAKSFSDKLDMLNTQVLNYMKKNKGKKVVTFGPGLEYFANRYGFSIASNIIIEPNNQTQIDNIKNLISNQTKKIAFAYKELQNIENKNNAYAIGAFLYHIDLYYSNQKKRYADFILSNSRLIAKALE